MARDRRRAALLLAGVTAMAIATLFWGAAPVLAHAALKGSSPAKGAQVPLSPARVEIAFTNGIQTAAGTYDILVNKDRGSSVTAGPAVVDATDPSRLSVPLKPGLAPGRYVVNWKNVADEDGESGEGAFSFYVGDYTPTTIDLANDAQLELVGAEKDETPGTSDTPLSSEDTPAAGRTAATTPAAVATVTVTSGAETGDGDSGNSNVIRYVAIAVGVGAVAAVVGFFVARGRS